MKVRVEAISAFKQLTLIDHSRGRGAVGEPARPGGADNRSAFVLWSITRAILARNPHVACCCHQEKIGRDALSSLRRLTIERAARWFAIRIAMFLPLFREHFAEQLPARTIEPHHSQLTYRGIVVRAIVKSYRPEATYPIPGWKWTSPASSHFRG